MNKKLSEEQLEQMLRTLVRDSAFSEDEVNEIADSPSIWWAVKADIADAKAASAMPWPPANWMRRIFAVTVPALTAITIAIALFISRPVIVPTEIASDTLPAVNTTPPSESVVPEQFDAVESSSKTTPAITQVTGRHTQKKASAKVVKRVPQPALPEIKTEFIALSYARNPDSGQIVRVKVPSSMMVSLGLVQTVEKPTNLIDAEVLVGDDGLTRAIRFIR